ncbi:MAG: TRAP transporter substrate-binding protein DctP [Syntrophobacteraceae bacterium]
MNIWTWKTGRQIRLAALIILASVNAVWAGNEVIVKMATLAPQGSEFYRILQEMGAAWEKDSNGQVAFRLYPGGVAGDDADIVRKMRLGTLNAGLLTVTGLAAIDRSVLALEIPLAYTDYNESDCVRDQIGPKIAKQFETKGFVLLGWSDAGWTHFFTKAPVRAPDDMKKLKMFVWAGDDLYNELWKEAGFNPVPLPSTEISTALQTGLVNAVTSTAQGVVLLQWYNQVSYMSDLKWALFLGGMVVTKSLWEKIPADVRPAIKEAARNACRRMSEFSRRSEPKDIDVLKNHGVEVVPVDDAALSRWRRIIEGAVPQVRGTYVPAEFLDPALELRDQCREAAKGSGP